MYEIDKTYNILLIGLILYSIVLEFLKVKILCELLDYGYTKLA